MTGSDEKCSIPIELLDCEKIVRVIKTPYYFHKRRKSEITSKAFFPPPGQSDVSVIRHILGDEVCFEQARKTALPAEYAGLLVTCAGKIREMGSFVYDHRADFCGHAHINHEIVMPAKGEAMDPLLRDQLSTRCDLILKHCKFHQDSHEGESPRISDPL